MCCPTSVVVSKNGGPKCLAMRSSGTFHVISAVLLGSSPTVHRGPLRLYVPQWDSVNWVSVAIAAASAIALLRFKAGLIWVLTGAAAVGLLAYVVAR